MNTIRRKTGVLAVVCASIVWGTSVDAAFPRLVMVSGGTLTSPVVLTDWAETAELMKHLGPSKPLAVEQLEGRPFLQVSLFWGPRWKQFMDDGRPIAELRHQDANEFGRLYPAVGNRPAVLVLTGAPRAFDANVAPPTTLDGFRNARELTPVSIGILNRAGIRVGSAD